MYNSKFVLIIDLIFLGLFTVLGFAVGITHFGEQYNELYFSTSFICSVLVKLVAEKLETFNKKK